ncbi:MAG: BspA family leucine-rich repeat surface protein, partial [Flavobacteriaceae bacterium]
LRVNTGGVATTYDGNEYVADAYFDMGHMLDRPQTGLPEPYQTFRFSRSQVMGYDIPLENGEYTVKLHFAELWFGATGGGDGGAGKRIFDISLEGQLAEDNLDIYAEVGAEVMLVKTHTVTVTDGVLNIDFDAREEVGGERHPVINAIEILEITEPVQRPFITTWNTDVNGLSNYDQITISTHPYETYNYTVDWGDGSTSENVTGNIVHTYESRGTYRVSISGDFPRMYFGHGSDPSKLIFINQWGDMNWSSMEEAFKGCENLEVLAADVPDLSRVSSLARMFSGTIHLRGNPSFSNWDVSNITNMSRMFHETYFNQDISSWDVSNVTNMSGMFSGAHKFNQDISPWDVSDVTNMSGMFLGVDFNTHEFDQPIGSWDVSNVTDMSSMFGSAEGYCNFNQPLNDWDVSNVVTMRGMFGGAKNFNQDISQWNVSNVTDMSWMFGEDDDIFIPLDFNQDISSWDTSSVTDMEGMFSHAIAFNQDISNWNVDNVTNMSWMFANPYVPLGGNHSFDYNLGAWNVMNVSQMEGIFSNVALSGENYDKTLVGWSQLPSLQNGVRLDAPNNNYCLAKEARQNIIDTYGWTINDAGEAEDCSNTFDFALRINAGGSEIEYNDYTFIADTYYNTGNTLSNPRTGLAEPYQSFRYGPSQIMRYNIPLENGEYTVKLHFAELWFGATGGGSGGVGSRVFDVSLEGQLAEDNLDIFAEVGADAMLVKTHTVTVTDGALNIDFDARDEVGGERHPVINVIEILGNDGNSGKGYVVKGAQDNQMD